MIWLIALIYFLVIAVVLKAGLGSLFKKPLKLAPEIKIKKKPNNIAVKIAKFDKLQIPAVERRTPLLKGVGQVKQFDFWKADKNKQNQVKLGVPKGSAVLTGISPQEVIERDRAIKKESKEKWYYVEPRNFFEAKELYETGKYNGWCIKASSALDALLKTYSHPDYCSINPKSLALQYQSTVGYAFPTVPYENNRREFYPPGEEYSCRVRTRFLIDKDKLIKKESKESREKWYYVEPTSCDAADSLLREGLYNAWCVKAVSPQEATKKVRSSQSVTFTGLLTTFGPYGTPTVPYESNVRQDSEKNIYRIRAMFLPAESKLKIKPVEPSIEQKLEAREADLKNWITAYNETEALCKDQEKKLDKLEKAYNENMRTSLKYQVQCSNQGRKINNLVIENQRLRKANESQIAGLESHYKQENERLKAELASLKNEDEVLRSNLIGNPDLIVKSLDYFSHRTYVGGLSEKALSYLAQLGYYRDTNSGGLLQKPSFKPKKGVKEAARDFVKDLLSDTVRNAHELGRWYKEL